MKKTTLTIKDTSHVRQSVRMRIVIEVTCDNHAAMFNRKRFNQRVMDRINLATHDEHGMMFAGHPLALVTTEEV